MEITFVETEKGYPAIWEQGGSFTHKGEALIIADENGSPPKPLRVDRSEARGKHALIAIKERYFLIKVEKIKEDFNIEIYKVLEVTQKSAEKEAGISVKKIFEFSDGKWDKEHSIPTYIKIAIEKAKEKANCYNCSEPHFIAPFSSQNTKSKHNFGKQGFKRRK